MKKIIFMLTAAALMASCANNDEINNNTDGTLIQAKPVHELVDGSVTRAPFDGAIASGNPLAARVLTYDEEGNLHTDGVMTFASATNAVTYSSITGGDGNGKFEVGVTDPYTLYGLYPSTEWSTASAMATDKLTFTFTGKEDVMVTAAATTSEAAVTAGTTPSLVFNHQLTKFTVKVKALNTEATAVWKEVSDIKLTAIKSDANKVYTKATYDLNANEVTFDTPADEEDGMSFWKITNGTTFTNTEFTGQAADIPVSATPPAIAYSMVAPFTATADKDITLSVTAMFSENEGDTWTPETKAINLNVPPAAGNTSGYTAGYAYTITLTFSEKEVITASATVTEWADGGEVGGVIM